jgi:hypothetical protein
MKKLIALLLLLNSSIAFAQADAGANDALPTNARIGGAYSGQSNMLGSDNDGGGTASDADGLRASDAGITFLTEIGSASNETPVTASANFLTGADPLGRNVIAGNWAVGSTPYSGLAQGTSPYNRGLTQVTTSATYIAANRPSEQYCLAYFAIAHGENDDSNGAADVRPFSVAATYKNNLLTWQQNFSADTANHCLNYLPMVMLGQAASGELNPPVSRAETAIGMWLADLESSNHFTCAPHYSLSYLANNPHLTTASARRAGKYLGKCLDQIVIDRTGFNSLQPSLYAGTAGTGITATNNVVTVCFMGGDGSNLVLDTTLVSRKGHAYGFDYWDLQGDVPAISSVAINGTYPRCIDLTLTRNAAAPARVQYANYSATTVDPGAAQRLSVGGNVRDQDSITTGDASDTTPLYNWAWPFDKPVDVVSGSASSAWTFANTHSADSTGIAGNILSARALDTCNGLSSCTICADLRSNAATWPTAANAVIAKAASGQRQFDWRTTSTAGTLRFFVSSSLSDSANFCTTNASVFTGQTWYRVCQVLPSNTVYVNGALTTCTVTGAMPSSITTANSDFEILNSSDSQPANFNAAHVAIWQRSLSAADVLEDYCGNRSSCSSRTAQDARLMSTGCAANYWPLQQTLEDVGCGPTRNLISYGAITFEAIAP